MVVVLARQATQPGGIRSLKSILGLLISLKIRAQAILMWPDDFFPAGSCSATINRVCTVNPKLIWINFFEIFFGFGLYFNKS
jgi:hypothetical protein